MTTITIVAPVLIMLIIGVICRKTAMLSQTGVNNIKKFITTFALPLTIFHAVATAEYNKDVLLVFGMMLAVVIIAFLLGFALKGLVKEPYRKYFPYIMTIYEGGMIAYPLYQSLCGTEQMSNIAIIDVPCGVFAFGIYFGMLTMTDQGTKVSGKQLLLNALKTPTFVALLLGLLVGSLGLMNHFLATDVSRVYMAVKDMLTAPLSAMILLCVGYEFQLEKSSIGMCLKTVLVRFVIQAALLVAVIFLARQWGLSEFMQIGLIIYIMTLPSLCLSSYVKNEEAGKYMSTTSSLYMFITLVAYIVLASILG